MGGLKQSPPRAASAAGRPALSVHWQRWRFHLRVLKLNPGGEYPHHAKQSISFSAGLYITDPPFPPDRMTCVIYHTGPARPGGGARRALPLQRCCLRPSAQPGCGERDEGASVLGGGDWHSD